MAVSLDTIRAQIVARLSALVRTPTNPSGVLNYVGDIRGEPNAERGDFEHEQLDNPSVALVQCEGDKPNDQLGVKLLRGGTREQVTLSTWRVFVSIQEPRDAGAEWHGSPGAVGMLDAVDAVRGALTGFRIVGTPAVLNVVITGAPNTSPTWAADARLAVSGVEYAPAVLGATLDGDGEAVISVVTATHGAIGTQLLGTTLTWNATPADLDATARVVAVTTRGSSGLWRGETLRFLDHAHRGSRTGQIAVRMLRFTALHVIPRAHNPQPFQASPLSLAADVNLGSTLDAPDDPQNPVDKILAEAES